MKNIILFAVLALAVVSATEQAQLEGIGQDFAVGFISGLQTNRDSETRCLVQSGTIASAFEDAIVEITKLINGADFDIVKIQMIVFKLIADTTTVNSVCHFDELWQNISSISSMLDWAKVSFRIAQNIFVFTSDAMNLGVAVANEDYLLLGMSIGGITKVVSGFELT